MRSDAKLSEGPVADKNTDNEATRKYLHQSLHRESLLVLSLESLLQVKEVKNKAAEQIAEETSQTEDSGGVGQHAEDQQREYDGHVLTHEVVVLDVEQ